MKRPRWQGAEAGRSRHRRQAARLHRGENGVLRARTSRSPASACRPRSAQRAFDLKDGEVSEALQTPQGYAFSPSPASRTHVADARRGEGQGPRRRGQAEGGRDRAAEGGVASPAQLKTGDFAAAAKAAGLEAKTTELVPRGSPIADVGVSPAMDAVAFALPAGGVSDPIVTDNGAVVVKVVERVGVTRSRTWRRGATACASELLQRAAQSVLHRLHGEGARADADQRQPADRGADTRVAT